MTKRRNFLIKSSLLTAGIFTGILSRRATTIATDNSNDLYQIGPMNGYTPRIGTVLVDRNNDAGLDYKRA